MRRASNVVALGVGLLLGGFAAYASAAMSILVCGSSSYTCPADDPVQSIGSSVTTKSLCDENGNCITAGMTPLFQGVTPAGWSSPTQPPSTATPNTMYKTATQSQAYGTPQEAGDVWRASNGYIKGDAPPDDTTAVYGCAATVSNCWATNNGKRSAALTTVSQCPAGYTGTTTCTLSNPALVQKPTDGKCSILRTGNTYAPDANDPDCSSSNPASVAAGLNVVLSGNKITASAGGKTVQIDTDVNTGASVLTISNPSGDGLSSTVNKQAFSGGSAPVVTGNSQSTIQGTGTLAQSGDTSAPTKADIPTDYMRDATGLAIKGGVDDLNSKLDPSGVDTTLQTAKDDYKSKEDDHKNLVKGIGDAGLVDHGISWSWSPVIPSGACWEPVMSFAGRTVTWTWCDKIEWLKSLLAWVFFIMTGFGIFEMFTRKGG